MTALAALRRHVWFILEAVLVVAVVTGVASSLRTPTYRASATVLLRPNDPVERLNPGNGPPGGFDPDRYVEAQKGIVHSEPVVRAAARAVPGVSLGHLWRAVRVQQGGRSDLLTIAAVDGDPGRARNMANAVARSYIENRRESAVLALRRAADEIEAKLDGLGRTIGAPDAGVGDATRARVARSATTTTQPLKPERYAAAVQFETLYARLQEVHVDISLKRGEAELIAEATLPKQPVSPHPKRDAAMGAFVGLFMGGGVTLLREQLEDRARSAEDLESCTGLPTLAQLPFDAAAANGASPVAVASRPTAPLAEAVRSLRTSISAMAPEKPVRVILVTSAGPGEGKSLVAANLAAAYAQAGSRALLVSADLRRPGAASLLGVSAALPGLSDLLCSIPLGLDRTTADGAPNGSALATATRERVLVQTALENLSVLPPGPVPPDPAELLGSERMGEVLAELSAASDVVVVDTPPLLPVADAAILAARADGVVLVTAVGETRREPLRRATAMLGRTAAPVLGAVINKAPTADTPYYYGERTEERTRRRRGGRGSSTGEERSPSASRR